MTPTRNLLILLAAAGSVAVLLGALGFQYLGDLPPCKLCIYQRWPHVAAVVIALGALATRGPALRSPMARKAPTMPDRHRPVMPMAV